jgi:hypothetical protein
MPVLPLWACHQVPCQAWGKRLADVVVAVAFLLLYTSMP